MSFVDDLRENTLVDVFPIEPRRALAQKRFLLQVCFAFLTVVAGCVDRLYFHRDKIYQVTLAADPRQHPVNEISAALPARRKPQLFPPALSEDCNTLPSLVGNRICG